MALKSRLFAGNKELEAAAKAHPSHITPGAKGVHVREIQGALQALDGAKIDDLEIRTSTYGKSTAAAVLAYKAKRDIVNRSYQQKADNICGIMTVTRMDEELAAAERPGLYVPVSHGCERGLQPPSPSGQYDQPVMPMSDAQMIAHLQRGTSPEARALVADLGGGSGPLVAARMPGVRVASAALKPGTPLRRG